MPTDPFSLSSLKISLSTFPNYTKFVARRILKLQHDEKVYRDLFGRIFLAKSVLNSVLILSFLRLRDSRYHFSLSGYKCVSISDKLTISPQRSFAQWLGE